MIAAPKSGSGKTLITCALIRALKDMGESVRAFKCGPDYIDPMFHRDVLGISSKNLDTFFTGEEGTRRLFEKSAKAGDFAVFEGVMGLFDGLGGTGEEGSSYHLAKVTDTPVILVVDAKGMGRSVIALIAGFLKYDHKQLIKGVILNRTSRAFFEVLKPLIERELGIRALGSFSDNKGLCIESRHLGLVMPGEIDDLNEKLVLAADELEKNVDVEGLLEIARAAVDTDNEKKLNENIANESSCEIPAQDTDKESRCQPSRETSGRVSNRPVIAVARDEAFCFLYEDNLALLEGFGARLEFFSPLRDKHLPVGSRGLLLCGGYPELFLEELSGNRQMLEEIRRAYASGMPTIAECGGFMYLHEEIKDRFNKAYPMVGAVNSACFYTGGLVRFGYIELREKRSLFLAPGESIKGHEFHHFDSDMNGTDCVASKSAGKGREYECVIAGEGRFVGFPHLYYPSNPEFAERIVKML